MIEFGKTLREAREAKGYTINQLANATNLMHQIVADLEEENFYNSYYCISIRHN